MVAETDNFVKQKSTTTGTGDFTLSDLSPARRSFNTAFGTGGTDKFQYAIYHQGNNQYEFGTGHLSDSTTLVRDTVEDSSNGDSLVNFTSGDKIVLCDIQAAKYGSPKGYLEPGALTISNNGTDSDHDIDVTGGILGVHDFSGEWFRVELADESPAFAIDSSGDDGLINSSSLTADTWYELAVVADSSGSNSPSVVGYTDANRPTATSDLPTGFDLFRAMGTPGRTWWIKTDGSSNILSFTHHDNGWIKWDPSTFVVFSNLLSDGGGNAGTQQSFSISSQAPPIEVDVQFQDAWCSHDSGGGQVGFGHEAGSSPSRYQIRRFLKSHTNAKWNYWHPLIRGITGQTAHYRYNQSTIDNVTITKVSAFKAV